MTRNVRESPSGAGDHAGLPETGFLRDVRKGLENTGALTALFMSVVLLAAIGVGDSMSGPQLSLSSLYLIPILIVTWKISGKAGIAMSCLAYSLWTGVNLHTGETNVSASYVYSEGIIKLATALLFILLLSKLKQSLANEARLARHDFLTRLANRTAFYETVGTEMSRCRRFGHVLSIAYIDLDNFKQLNDRLGHRAGDNALKAIAEVMRTTLRSTDVPARLGGDEFAVMLTEADASAAAKAVRMLHSRLLKRMQKRGWPITFSIGLATFAAIPGSVDEMIKRADGLMYLVKKDGKGDIKTEVFS
jgi:diguanylate cyclase (GGDEF)-like protein